MAQINPHAAVRTPQPSNMTSGGQHPIHRRLLRLTRLSMTLPGPRHVGEGHGQSTVTTSITSTPPPPPPPSPPRRHAAAAAGRGRLAAGGGRGREARAEPSRLAKWKSLLARAMNDPPTRTAPHDVPRRPGPGGGGAPGDAISSAMSGDGGPCNVHETREVQGKDR